MSLCFVADVGGTNIRVATVIDGQLKDIEKMLCDDFASIDLAIDAYFKKHGQRKFNAGCIAIACPVNQDQVTMTNHSWTFSQSALKAQLGLEHLSVINDFTAVAYSLPELKADQVIQIGHGQSVTHGNTVVFGPGTGLGVEHITHTSDGWRTLDGEGGHVDFAPTSEDEIIVWRYINTLHGRASTEEVLSGRGLLNIYTALGEHRNQTLVKSHPSEITESALDGSCQLCMDSLALFCRVMGNFAGDLALNLATQGGVYIGGGIANRFSDFLQKSEFRQCFEAKGPISHCVKDIPTFLITEPFHGLIGAYAYLNQTIARTNNEQ